MDTRIRTAGGSVYCLIPQFVAKEFGLTNGTELKATLSGSIFSIVLPKKDQGDLIELRKILQGENKKWTLPELCKRMFGKLTDENRLRCGVALNALVATESHVHYDKELKVAYWGNIIEQI